MRSKLQILPFRGLRYALNSGDSQRELSAVTAPPYDVISPADQQALYDRHPQNVVRLILNQKQDSDTAENSVYTRAAQFNREWQEQGVMSPDDAPCFYAYAQEWEGIERKGIIGLLRLEQLDTGKVLPHENTLGGPKVDRFNLMKSTMANLSQIFMIYSDPQCQLEAAVFSSSPETDEQYQDAGWSTAVDADQVIHRIKPLSNPPLLKQIQTLFEDQTLLIADGHHRYETALIFKNEVRQLQFRDKGLPEPPDGALLSDYVMVFLTNMDDPGLRVFPTHRVLYRWPEGWDRARFESALLEQMDVVPADQAEWSYWGEADKAPLPLKLKSPQTMAGVPEVLRDLDVAQLEEVVFKGLFKDTPDALKSTGILGFYRDEAEVVRMMKDGDAVAVFYMKAPPVAQVREVSEAGFRMPQKSTYFYPKLLSGLVFHSYAPFYRATGHSLTGAVLVETGAEASALPAELFQRAPLTQPG